MAPDPSFNPAPSINLISRTGSSRSPLTPHEVEDVVSTLQTPVKHDHMPTVPEDAVSGVASRDNRTEAAYRLLGNNLNLNSAPEFKPPLSRCPTENDSGQGDPVRTMSALEAYQEEAEKRLQRARTQLSLGESSSSSSLGKLSKSQTKAVLGSGKSKRDPDLGDQITNAMELMGEIGLDEPKSYLPDEWHPMLVTPANIKRALKKPSDSIINFTINNPKLFAITLLVHSDKSSRTRAMNAFQSHDFTDAFLPVEKMSSPEMCSVEFNWNDSDDESDESDKSESSDEMSTQCKHRPQAAAFHCAPWKQASFTTFFEKQWSFLIPKILEEKFEYHFSDREILPFEKSRNEIMGGGHFGDIFPAIMLAKYQTAIETNQEMILVAVKEMRLHTGQEYDNHGNWKREVKALRVFNQLKDKHIVRGIGAFTQRGKRFLIMEWANGGDLRNVYLKNPNPHVDLTEARVAQFLEQFRGLANALNQMHDYKVMSNGDSAGLAITKEQQVGSDRLYDTKLPSNPSIQVSGSEDAKIGGFRTKEAEIEEQTKDKQKLHDGKVQSEEPEREAKATESAYSKTTENWRHGDLKPDNILSFEEGRSSWLGRLKLADFGSARQHMDKTGRRNGTNNIFTTLSYDPPEVWTALKNGRSRLVDIWAFGCVLLESVIWLLFGIEELKKFRGRIVGFGSLYWTAESLHNKIAKRDEVTFEWIDELLDEDPECKLSKRGSAMRDLILLIKDKLLVMKLPKDSEVPEEGCRINSRMLVNELDKIIHKGKQHPSYLFSGRARADIAAPEIA